MNKTERLEKLKRLISTQFSDVEPFIDSLHDVNDRTSDYLLYWEDNKNRAIICARTGNITAYRQCDADGIASECHGDDLQEFGDVVDTHILKLEDKGRIK